MITNKVIKEYKINGYEGHISNRSNTLLGNPKDKAENFDKSEIYEILYCNTLRDLT